MMMQYLLYLSKTFSCSRVKCRLAAQSISFLFRHVLNPPKADIPSVVYPRKITKLPEVMYSEKILSLINSVENVKHRTIISLLYSISPEARPTIQAWRCSSATTRRVQVSGIKLNTAFFPISVSTGEQNH